MRSPGNGAIISLPDLGILVTVPNRKTGPSRTAHATSGLVAWVEDHIEETLTVYRLPREHPPADEVHEHAGAVQRGAPSANACREDLP